MNTIADTRASSSVSTVQDDVPLAGGTPGVPSGSLKNSSAARSQTYVDEQAPPTGVRLTPKQKMMADLEALMGVYLDIFTMARLAARENSTFTVMSMMRLVELAAAKMLSSALAQFIGGVVQGGMGIVSGCMQVGSALKSMQALKSGAQRMQPAMRDAEAAKQELNAAELDAAQYANQPSPHTQAKVAADNRVTTAQNDYLMKQQVVKAEWKSFTESSEFKQMEADATFWHGMSTATKNLGELLEAICKYYASGEEKDKMLVEALEKYLQVSQQNNQEFTRDLDEMVRQLLDQLKSKIEREHQVNMNTAQNV